MRFLFSIFFVVSFQLTYAQAAIIKTHNGGKTGKVEKCIITETNKEKCEWVARLTYKDLSRGRYYTLKYKTPNGTSGSKTKRDVRKVTFSKNEMELHYVYRQIERWMENTDKPEKIKIALGDYTLEVSERKAEKKHELYFTFEKKGQKREENFYNNGLLFNADDLGELFGIKE